MGMGLLDNRVVEGVGFSPLLLLWREAAVVGHATSFLC